MRPTDVHTEHCCEAHGCKYSQDATCTVVTGQLKQSFTCEWCDEDIEQMEEAMTPNTAAPAALTPEQVPSNHWSNMPSQEQISAALGGIGAMLVSNTSSTTLNVWLVVYRGMGYRGMGGGIFGTVHLNENEAREAVIELLKGRKTQGYMYHRTLSMTTTAAVQTV